MATGLVTRMRLEDLVDPASICRGDAIEEKAAIYPAYRLGIDWIRNFIMQPNADLKRIGSVCPFVGQAMAADTMVFAIRTGARGGAQAAFEMMVPFIEVFRALEPKVAPLLGLKALTVFFPDLPEAEMAEFIDGGHRLLKPYMIERGLMLGEFHPLSTTPGATNPDFHAMRAPVPAFVIREMAMHDTKFMTFDSEPVERQVQYLRAFMQRVAPTAPTKVRKSAAAMLAAAEARLAAG